MSVEEQLRVRIDASDEARVRALQVSAAAALRRIADAPLGDQTDAIRFEQIHAELDGIAFDTLARGQGDSVVRPSTVELTVAWPFATGATDRRAVQGVARPARYAWRSAQPEAAGRPSREKRRDAVAERFDEQLSAWLEGTDQLGEHASMDERDRAPEPICPNGISNFTLSEGLRAFLASGPGQQRVDAPVVYRDGSAARALPLRSLPLCAILPDDRRLALRLTLLSVRHMQMDATVDGAWLRNREISRPRAGALTDELVYTQSRRQLAELSADAPIIIHMFQTGLEPAIVGFYRALADHHLEHSGHPVAVQPWYFEGHNEFSPGTAWVVNS